MGLGLDFGVGIWGRDLGLGLGVGITGRDLGLVFGVGIWGMDFGYGFGVGIWGRDLGSGFGALKRKTHKKTLVFLIPQHPRTQRDRRNVQKGVSQKTPKKGGCYLPRWCWCCSASYA